MKTLVALTLLIVITSCQAQNASSLDVDEFEKGLQSGNVQLLDVRSTEEYNSGHLINSLQADWNNKQQFKERTQYLDKSKPVYVYCLSGARSAAAARKLKDEGFTEVVNLQGGIVAWKQANKPVEGLAKVKQLTLAEYASMINSDKPVLVDFGANWCPPCKKMEPIINQLKNESAGKFSIVNIDGATQTEILKELGVEAFPVFIVYKNGKQVWRHDGVVSLEELKSKLN